MFPNLNRVHNDPECVNGKVVRYPQFMQIQMPESKSIIGYLTAFSPTKLNLLEYRFDYGANIAERSSTN